MPTLLMCLSGPLQSWGVQSNFDERDTGLEPSKSGVIGMVCAAMGIARHDEDTLATLAALRFGVRADREGRLMRDFHIAQNLLQADGVAKYPSVSNRHYLAGAAFLAGLESDDLLLLERIQAALLTPVWPLCLGRKAFVPGDMVAMKTGLRAGEDLLTALTNFPRLAKTEHKSLRVVAEDPLGEALRSDQPVSFAARRFALRRVKTFYVAAPDEVLEVA